MNWKSGIGNLIYVPAVVVPMAMLLFAQTYAPAYSAEPASDPDSDVIEFTGGNTFKLGVQKIKQLPPAMYGVWSIRITILETDLPPGLFELEGNDIWSLQRSETDVTLKNEVNQVATSINIDSVEGNRATFHHRFRISERTRVTEAPTIAVDGDKLDGINNQTVEIYRKGKLAEVYHRTIRLEGTRLSGARFSFKDPENEPKSFEVAPLQFKNEF